MTPSISICIPAYGRPRELADAIESVLAQDHEDLELVVTDDSGDLEEVVAGFGDGRLSYHRNPERLGMAANWTHAMDLARADLRGLLMDDDRLLPGFASRVVEAAGANPDVEVVFTDHLNDWGGRVEPRDCGLAGGRYDDFLPHYMVHMPVAVSASVMRRSLWERLRPLPPIKTADVWMYVRAAQMGAAFLYVDEPLMVYRRHAGQLSREDAFRGDVVAVWDGFEFDDPDCERRRRERLAEALRGRAAAHLRLGEGQAARADVDRAAELSAGALPVRARAVRFLSGRPALARLALSTLDRARAAGR